MCAACDIENVPASAFSFLSDEVMEAIRLVERELMIKPAEEKDWAIYLGRESGSIAWGQLEQMQRCHAGALLLLGQQQRLPASALSYQPQGARGRRPAANAARPARMRLTCASASGVQAS